MTYAHDDGNLYVTFFAESATQAEIGGTEVGIQQSTAYPNDGKIRLHLKPKKPVKFALRLRIPTWTGEQFVPGKLYRYANAGLVRQWSLKVNGQSVKAKVEKGFAVIDRQWKAGDRVELNLPMPVRINTCHKAVVANHDRLALTRGPFVLCAEGWTTAAQRSASFSRACPPWPMSPSRPPRSRLAVSFRLTCR